MEYRLEIFHKDHEFVTDWQDVASDGLQKVYELLEATYKLDYLRIVEGGEFVYIPGNIIQNSVVRLEIKDE